MLKRSPMRMTARAGFVHSKAVGLPFQGRMYAVMHVADLIVVIDHEHGAWLRWH